MGRKLSHAFCIAVVAAATICCGGNASAQGNAKQLLALPTDKLVAILEREDSSLFDRAKAAQRLALVGDKSAVAALASHLDDEQLNAYVRTALESIPDPAAVAALREAATKLDGRPLVGAVQSLGVLRDTESLKLLDSLLQHDNTQVRDAAANSLGRIGTPEAARRLAAALKSSDKEAVALTMACLRCAEQLERDQAVALYDAVISSDTTASIKHAAELARYALTPDDAGSWLQEQLQASDAAAFDAGLVAVRQIPGKATADAIHRALPELSSDRQALLLQAMVAREEGVPVDLLTRLAGSDTPEVRKAAIESLVRQADSESIGALVDVAFSDSAASTLALKTLQQASGDSIDQAILSRASQSNVSASVELVELIGARRLTGLKPRVRDWMSHDEKEIRTASMTAMAQVGDAADLELLLSRALADKESGETDSARKALRTMALRLSDREAAAARLAEEMGNASAEQQDYLLRLLREMGSKTSLKVVTDAAKSSDVALKEVATRELGSWPNVDAANTLLEIAKNDSESKYRIRALRGYLRIGRQFQLSDSERMEYFNKIMEVAERPQEKQVAFKILEKVPTTETLAKCVKAMEDDAVKVQAAEAAIFISPKLVESDPQKVAEAMQKALDVGVEGDWVTHAKQLLEKAKSASK